MSDRWTVDHIPDQSGRCVVITGANSGLGLEMTRQLAGRGADVVMACRDPRKAEDALASVRAEHPDARVEALSLDLADLGSVGDFATRLLDERPQLDVLCNNAGVMALPQRTTRDGFEMQLGTNHLGHFALTSLLLPRLLESAAPRVVTLSSTAHRMGKMNFDDLQSERAYSRWGAYGQSKLANLLFHFELQRRAQTAGVPLLCAAAHPGYASTNLQFAGPRLDGSNFMESVMGVMNRVFSQSVEMGALPQLYAATSEDVKPGDYIGPDGLGEAWGHPKVVGCSRRAQDANAAARLWTESEALTRTHFEPLEGSH